MRNEKVYKSSLPAAGTDYCTLVTCTPYGVNTHRLLVRGSRIPYEEAEILVEEIQTEEVETSTWEQQYIRGLVIGLKVLLSLILLILIVANIRKRKKRGGNYAKR